MAQAGDLFWKILDSIFASARDEPKTARGKWAGEILAEVMAALSKREDALDCNPGFRSRWRILKSLRIPTTPVWDWIERAVQRIDFLLEWSEGLHPSASPTEFEKTIPSLLDELESLEGDQANAAFFEKILWPWLQEHAVEIKSEAWFKPLAKSRHPEEVKTLTLALIRKDFRDVWKVFADRPVGRLYRITRSR
jgi:hypothetical protein